eukprot:SAG11_NODE_4227_length_2001_cov_1.447424_2_plen_153_part_00
MAFVHRGYELQSLSDDYLEEMLLHAAHEPLCFNPDGHVVGLTVNDFAVLWSHLNDSDGTAPEDHSDLPNRLADWSADDVGTWVLESGLEHELGLPGVGYDLETAVRQEPVDGARLVQVGLFGWQDGLVVSKRSRHKNPISSPGARIFIQLWC